MNRTLSDLLNDTYGYAPAILDAMSDADIETLEVGLAARGVGLMLAEVERRQPDAFVYVSHHDGLWWASYSATAGQAAGSKLVWDKSLHAALTSLLKKLPEVPA